MWAGRDIVGIHLTANDRINPYPDVVHSCLANKLNNARAIKREMVGSIGEKRRILMDKHRSCHRRAKSDLNVLFGVTRAECKKKGKDGGD